MAIVEDEMRNESEEENDIVVVEEYDGEQDSDDSDDDDADDAALERKVELFDLRLKQDPYNYDDHIEKIQALWGLSQLDRWRSSFTALHQMMTVKPEHWVMRLHTETSVSHTAESNEKIAELFQQAALDCYSTEILSEWCSWSLSFGDMSHTRAQMEEVLRRAGADPLSGKVFWDAKLEFEKALLEGINVKDEKYKEQRDRVLFCLEEIVSRPLLRSDEMWQQFEELALDMHGQEYVDKAKKQHEAAQEYLQKITPYEDKLLTLENVDEKYNAYQEYIDAVHDLSKEDRFRECDSDGILKVLFERATTECSGHPSLGDLLRRFTRHARLTCSRSGLARVVRAAARRLPRQHTYWTMLMQQAEHEEKSFDEVKSIFEDALLKSMESYKQAESLWMSYLEYTRRRTDFTDEQHVERLRNTFRLAWDSLAAEWGEEANDCEVPVFWARLEYQRVKDHKRGKEVFEEIFRYGENKTMSKYWETLIRLEMNRTPSISENKLRDLFRRALRSITDYPPAVVNMWKDYERDFGQLNTLRDCTETCEPKLKEWRDYYKSMKDKMTGKKQQKTNKNDKKNKFDKKKKQEEKPQNKGKRKSEGNEGGSEVKRKKEESMDIDERDKEGNSSGVKRSHEDDEVVEEKDTKRQRTESSEDSRAAGREACTLFISNLEFKVNEQNLRDKLSEYGDIVSLRVKSGVKAFGGSICYCQYKTQSAVDEAIKHDRTPLDGRPMFLSRYSAKKTKPQFKYATTVEKNKLFVKNLPFANCTKQALADIFDKYGKLKDVRVVTHKDGKPKGLAYIEYEDDTSASQALEKCNGLKVGDRVIEVAVSAPPARQTAETSLGQPKRDGGGGMRRTQLSSFIPSVLQKPSTSKAVENQTNGEKRPLNNSDFRSMLLGNK